MKKVLLLYGGRSSEHDVSCLSANFVRRNIDKTLYTLHCVEITQDNHWIEDGDEVTDIVEFIKTFDVVFPIIHGKNGEDGTLQGMLDLFSIPYVGSKCGASYICMDKERTKQILNELNIPQVPFQTYKKNEPIWLSFPVITKPANGGSSIGIEVVKHKKDLKKACQNALKYDNKVIIEKFINAREIECAVLEDKKLIISEPGEIISANSFYDFEAKYKNKESKTVIPANIPKDVKKQIQKYAKIIFEELGLSGLARIDFFYDKENEQIYLNEINTIPGFTEISMYPKLMLDKGINHTELITKLIENAK